jgi:hypothetical protein
MIGILRQFGQSGLYDGARTRQESMFDSAGPLDFVVKLQASNPRMMS